MLSGLAVAKYLALAEAKCARAGVQFKKVNPAYTSVAGRVKYAVRQGRTVHEAAAGVIGRVGQGYRESLPRSGTHRVPLAGASAELLLPVRNRNESPRTSWRNVNRELAQLWAALPRRRKPPRRHPDPAVRTKHGW